MSNFIEVNPITHGQQLLTVVAEFQKAYQDLLALQQHLHAFAYGNDETAVESAYGLQTGNGTAVVTLIDNTVTQLIGDGSTAFMQVIGRMGL